jgi:UDPglucose 6-dehydrogenase
MAELGHHVLCVDVDQHTVAAIRAGRAPFGEPGLDEHLARHVTAGRLRATDSYEQAADYAGVHFLCVPTPQQDTSLAADLSDLDQAFTELVKRLRRNAVVVVKSSVPVGTTADLADLGRALTPAGVAVEVVASPDFMRESHSIPDVLRPSRIVLGLPPGSTTASGILRQVWQPSITAGTPLIVTDLATAELSKVAANAFLATKISFINALAAVCEAAGANANQLAHTLAADPRITGHALTPGIGFGGSCLTKDIRALIARADELGVGHEMRFLTEIDAVNQRRRTRMVDLARDACGGILAGKRVTAWGASFKPDTDDIRDSPALAIALALSNEGADVTVCDPAATHLARARHPQLTYTTDPITDATGAHVLLHLTDWPHFRTTDPTKLLPLVTTPTVIDGRSTLDQPRWEQAGWTYLAPGR